MIREIIGTGKTPEEATQDALRQLGVDTLDDSMELDVIEQPKAKVLGIFGGKEAKVKITIKASAKDATEKFLSDVIKGMGLENITIDTKEVDNSIEIDIEGEDVGFVIGRRGETLDALQYLSCLVANKVDNSYKRVTITTGDYREKREKTLEALGRKRAFKAVKTGRKEILEPMNPYERKIIHTAVQKVNGATSWSEGESINRHVVIGVDPKARNNRNGKGRKPYNKNRANNNKVEATKDPNRAPLNEGEGVGLYGRIDK